MPHWINPANGICRRRQKYAVQGVHSGAELIREREPLFEFLVVPPDLDFEATQPEGTLSRHLRYRSYWLLSVELAPPATASKATLRLLRTGQCALPTPASPIPADSERIDASLKRTSLGRGPAGCPRLWVDLVSIRRKEGSRRRRGRGDQPRIYGDGMQSVN